MPTESFEQRKKVAWNVLLEWMDEEQRQNQSFTQATFAERIGKSAIPAREMLHYFMGQGIIARDDTDHWQIARKLLDSAYRREMMNLRCAIETLQAKDLARSPDKHHTDEKLTDIHAEMQGVMNDVKSQEPSLNNTIEFWTLDTDWHAAISEGSGSRAAADTIRSIRRQHGLFYRYVSVEHMRVTLKDHLEIQQAIADYDVDKPPRENKKRLTKLNDLIYTHINESWKRFYDTPDLPRPDM